MKIVLDTNVLIASFISRGACSDLVEHCVQLHDLVTSEFILHEFADKLISKFRIARPEVHEASNLLRDYMEIVVPTEPDRSLCRDPDDVLVIGTAMAGRCRCIITGDKDLLVLRKISSIDILPPRDFWRYENEQKRS